MQQPPNPHDANPPDFHAEKYLAARQRLIDSFGINHEEAATQLTNSWIDQNTVDRQEWNDRQAAIEEQQRQERDQLRLQQEEAQRAKAQEEEEARKEERKKYRTKFLPFADVPPPSMGSIPILPSPLAIRKLQKGEYVPLYPFTNKGLAEAENLSLEDDDDALAIVPDEQGFHTFVPIASAKTKGTMVRDKDLTWSQIDEATHRMLQAMEEANWPKERLDAMIGFWMNLGLHEWRHDDDTSRQALLIYQHIYRRKWHDSLGTPASFNLKLIDQDALNRIRAKITNQKHQEAERKATEATNKLLATIATLQSSIPHAQSTATMPFPSALTALSMKQPVAAKRPSSPPADMTQTAPKRNKTFRAPTTTTNGILPPCAVCLSIDPHTIPVVECTAERTWDNKHETFAKRSDKALIAKATNQRICSKWQHREGCYNNHSHAHICSGCGSATHGAFRCPRGQKRPSSNAL